MNCTDIIGNNLKAKYVLKMSVNIFGTSGISTSKSDNKYVDRKFITLTNNLHTKVNKTGDTLTGHLAMGENTITSSYIGLPVDEVDLINKKYIDNLNTAGGEMSTLSITSKLNNKLDKTGGILTGPLDLGENKIISSHVAIHPHDIPNKEYVDSQLAHRLGAHDLEHIENKLSLKVNKTDRRYVRNNAGYVPDLNKNVAKSGFTVSASSESTPAYHVFNSWKGDWKVLDKTDMWIKIKCPEAIRIYKFVSRGKDNDTDKISHWKLEASDNDINWDTLYTGDNIVLDNEGENFLVNNITPYKYFMISVQEAQGSNPGLSYIQLFTLNEVGLRNN